MFNVDRFAEEWGISVEDARKLRDEPRCQYVLNGEPVMEGVLPENAVFVGMESHPNCPPRYGKLTHPWFNLPCYETPDFTSRRKNLNEV